MGGSLTTWGGRVGLALGERLRVPQSAMAMMHSLLQNHSLCAGPHLSMELLKSPTVWGPDPGAPCAIVSPGLFT